MCLSLKKNDKKLVIYKEKNQENSGGGTIIPGQERLFKILLKLNGVETALICEFSGIKLFDWKKSSTFNSPLISLSSSTKEKTIEIFTFSSIDATIMVGTTNNERRRAKNPKAILRYVFFSNFNLTRLMM
jgi:hypothetical protein